MITIKPIDVPNDMSIVNALDPTINIISDSLEMMGYDGEWELKVKERCKKPLKHKFELVRKGVAGIFLRTQPFNNRSCYEYFLGCYNKYNTDELFIKFKDNVDENGRFIRKRKKMVSTPIFVQEKPQEPTKKNIKDFLCLKPGNKSVFEMNVLENTLMAMCIATSTDEINRREATAAISKYLQIEDWLENNKTYKKKHGVVRVILNCLTENNFIERVFNETRTVSNKYIFTDKGINCINIAKKRLPDYIQDRLWKSTKNPIRKNTQDSPIDDVPSTIDDDPVSKNASLIEELLEEHDFLIEMKNQALKTSEELQQGIDDLKISKLTIATRKEIVEAELLEIQRQLKSKLTNIQKEESDLKTHIDKKHKEIEEWQFEALKSEERITEIKNILQTLVN